MTTVKIHLAACACAIASIANLLAATSGIVKSNVSAQKILNGIDGDRQYTAKDYVQDGLVAHFDGIENVGYGLHDGNAVVWKDLTGLTGDAIKVGFPTWNDNAGVTSGMNNTFQVSFTSSSRILDAIKGGNVTVEICFSHDYPTFTVRIPFAIEDSNSNSSTYRVLQILQHQYDGYQSAWFNKNGTNPLSSTSAAVDSQFGTYSITVSVKNLIAEMVPYWNGSVGIAANQPLGYSFTWDPSLIDTFGINVWYLRIGRTHNTYMNTRFHSVRIYSRVLTNIEIARNSAIDKARFNTL